MDIDAAGGVATAGLVGGAIEKPAGHAGEAHANCSDCGQPTSGRFCSNCGQPTHVHRSLLHLGEEILHGVLHFDARIWRTLPLLVINPGRLTREWVQGRRSRYVSPLAMFLFTVFVMFFAFSFMGAGHEAEGVKIDPVTQARADLSSVRAAVATLESQAGFARSETAIREVKATVPEIEARLAAAEKAAAIEGATKSSAEDEGRRPDGLEVGTWQANVRDAVLSGRIKFGDSYLSKKLQKKALNPDLALYKLQQTIYKFSFLLIPISIPFVALLFLWRRGFTLYDHGVFVLYSLTAMSMLFLVIALLGPLWSGFAFVATLLVAFGIPVHMFAQLKGAYSLSWFSAMWRTAFLLIFSLFALTLFLLAIIALGLTG